MPTRGVDHAAPSGPIRLRLGPIRALLGALGEPADRFPSVLLAGTNGKGSTGAMLASILGAAKYRTGFFHSPSLGAERQQVEVDGVAVEAPLFDGAEGRVRSAAGSLSEEAKAPEPGPSPFEQLTATAFLLFAEQEVEMAVVEAGMGGARDCTNAIRDPAVSALTSVALDHQQYLGSTLREIAAEKAGIFRPGRPAVLGWLDPEAEAAAVAVARELGAEPVLARNALHQLRSAPLDRGRQRLEVTTRHGTYEACLSLAGAHQSRNAALAVLIAEALAARGFGRITRESICRGLEDCRWPGRLEWILAPGRRPILLDSAHNPAGARSLAAYLTEQGLGQVDFLFGAFRDKDARAMLATLAPLARNLWLTGTDHPRAMEAHELALVVDLPTRSEVSFEAALRQAAAEDACPLVVAGSVDLVGRVRAHLLDALPTS